MQFQYILPKNVIVQFLFRPIIIYKKMFKSQVLQVYCSILQIEQKFLCNIPSMFTPPRDVQVSEI